MHRPIVLYRVRHPSEISKPWVANSLAELAQERSDLYEVRDFAAGSPPPPAGERAAIHVRKSVRFGDQVRWAVSDPAMRAWIEAGVPLVIDDSTEAGLSNPAQWQQLRQLLGAAGLKAGRMIYLQQNEHGPGNCATVFGDQSAIAASVIVFHYWLHRTRLQAGGLAERPDRSRRTSRFICLNRKMRAHRAIVIGRLLREGLFTRGLVSFTAVRPQMAGSEWSTFEGFARAALDKFPGFAAEIAAYRPLFDQQHILGDESARAKVILRDFHEQAGFSLINETEMSPGNKLRFTEKTLKPLATWHPFVVAGNPGTLRLLRGMGFQTFDPLIDERYDDVDDPDARLALVLEAARKLIVMEEGAFDRLLDALDPVLAHNVRHFHDGLPAIMEAQHAALGRAITARA